MTLVIRSVGVCPSNTMVEGNVFPNYAGRDDVDDLLEQELKAAGIKVEKWEFLKDRGEVKSSVRGTLCLDPDMPRCGWCFERAWYYWVATGQGIPPEYAEPLHKTHGKVVRVEGNCGCPSPLEYNRGFAVGLYHIDTPEGLKALADTIRQVFIDHKKKYEQNS